MKGLVRLRLVSKLERLYLTFNCALNIIVGVLHIFWRIHYISYVFFHKYARRRHWLDKDWLKSFTYKAKVQQKLFHFISKRLYSATAIYAKCYSSVLFSVRDSLGFSSTMRTYTLAKMHFTLIRNTAHRFKVSCTWSVCAFADHIVPIRSDTWAFMNHNLWFLNCI